MAEEKIIVARELTNKTPFVPVYHDLLDCGKLNGEELALLTHIRRYINTKTNTAFPSISRLSSKLQWGKDKVQKYIKNLESKGFIVKKNNVYETKQNNEYIIVDVNLINKLYDYKPYSEEIIASEILFEYSDRSGNVSRVACCSPKVKFQIECLLKMFPMMIGSMAQHYAKISNIELKNSFNLNYSKEELEELKKQTDEESEEFFYSLKLLLIDLSKKKYVELGKEKMLTEEYFARIIDTSINQLGETLFNVYFKFTRVNQSEGIKNKQNYLIKALHNARNVQVC